MAAGVEDDDDAPVLILCCRACAVVVCRRGMRVSLCADPSIALYSTDFAPAALTHAASARAIETCACLIVDLLCSGCTRSRRPTSRASARATASGAPTRGRVGYHVVAPCEECWSNGDHNEHHFIFDATSVVAAPWPQLGGEPPMTWARLRLFDGVRSPLVFARACTAPRARTPTNARAGRGHRAITTGGAREGSAEVGEGEVADALECAICLGPPRDAVRLRACGHIFCELCVTRHVDHARACPLDRRPASALDVLPDEVARRAVGRLRVHCRYGCARPTRASPPAKRVRRAYAPLADGVAPDGGGGDDDDDGSGCAYRCAEWDAGLRAEAWVAAPASAARPAHCPTVAPLARIGAHEARCAVRCLARACVEAARALHARGARVASRELEAGVVDEGARS
ncbi:hypothetical protein KFE25_003710 [Diacronema lutheri]|uniref:RING-type domain-containing protein n=1 Tax=Diacronema lutheri TaxID=2081491 RepID=A0A8J5X0C5_DIALT|nr:hypothetical protein KFE25_003710 [Diacronema lutheri]